MDSCDPLLDTLRHLSDVPINRSRKKNSIGSEETRDFARFDELFNGDLPCTLLYLDRNAQRLKAFKTLVDLTQFIETPDEKPRPNDRVIQKLQSAPAGQLVHYSTLEKYMQYLYRGDKFMDVIIDVDGTPFMAHRIVLCCHSSYFRNLLMHDSRPVKIPIQVKVFGVSVEAFAAFIEYLYSGKVYIHPGMINDFIYIAEYLDVKSLCDKLYSITGKMSLAESIKFLLRSRYPSGKHYSVALTKVISQFSEACMIAGFRDLNVDIFCSILKSDALMVTREYQVFQAAVRWIVHGGRNRVPFIPRVMSHIRFCHMTVDELFDCMDETRMFLDYKELSDLILIANWVRTATRWNKTDPFNFQVLPRRKGYANQHQKINLQRKQYKPPLVCTTNEEPRLPRQGKPVMVQANLINKSNTKRPVSPVLSPKGNIKKSPNYGKPVLLPVDQQRPVNDCNTSVPETISIQFSTAPSSDRLQLTGWTQTSSRESSPNRSPEWAQQSLFQQKLQRKQYKPPLVRTTNEEPRLPVMVQANLINKSNTKRPVSPVLSPKGNIIKSPNYGKPVLLPVDHNCNTSVPETISIAPSSDRLQLTSWTQTSSRESSPNRSPEWAQQSLFQQSDILAKRPWKMLSSDVKENISNHSRRYGSPDATPPKEDILETQSTPDSQETREEIVLRPSMSPACHSKPTNWSPVSSKEPVSGSNEPEVVLPPEESEELDNPNLKPIVKKLELPPFIYETQNLQLISQMKNIESHSTRYSKPSLRPYTEIQNPDIISRPKMSPASHVKPTTWSPESISEPITKYTRIQQDIIAPVCHTRNYAKPVLLPPDRASDKTSWMPPTEKCDCRPKMPPTGHGLPTSFWPNPTEPQKTECEAIPKKDPEKESVQRPIMSPAGDVQQNILALNSNQYSNKRANDSDSSLKVSAKVDCNSSSSENDEFVDAVEIQNLSSEKNLWFEAKDSIEIKSKEPAILPAPPLPKFLPKMPKVLPAKDIIGVCFFEENKPSDEKCGQGIPIEFCKMPEPRDAFAVARVGRKIYVIGGVSVTECNSGQKVTNTVFEMDCFDREWVQVASMNVARMSHSACVLDERIYVFGGLDGCGNALDSCEYYSPVMNRWVALWKMPVPIYAGSATTLGGKCYIAGGMTHNADDPTPRVRMTMICYDPRSRKWSVPGYLRMPLCHATLVNVQGRLLLCGGATYREEKARKRDLVSVASIDEYNILTNSWGFRTKMSSARQEVSAVTVGSKLYVIGGKNCEDEKIDQTVECYDTTFSTWKNCQFRLPTAVKNVKCVSCHNLK